MKKLTLAHSEAVSTAKLNLIRLTERDTSPRFKAEIERRIDRLGEVYWWILQAVHHPGLPLDNIYDANEKPEPEKSKDNGTKTKQK